MVDFNVNLLMYYISDSIADYRNNFLPHGLFPFNTAARSETLMNNIFTNYDICVTRVAVIISDVPHHFHIFPSGNEFSRVP